MIPGSWFEVVESEWAFKQFIVPNGGERLPPVYFARVRNKGYQLLAGVERGDQLVDVAGSEVVTIVNRTDGVGRWLGQYSAALVGKLKAADLADPDVRWTCHLGLGPRRGRG